MNFFNRNIELILNQCCGFDNKAKARGGGEGRAGGGVSLFPCKKFIPGKKKTQQMQNLQNDPAIQFFRVHIKSETYPSIFFVKGSNWGKFQLLITSTTSEK